MFLFTPGIRALLSHRCRQSLLTLSWHALPSLAPSCQNPQPPVHATIRRLVSLTATLTVNTVDALNITIRHAGVGKSRSHNKLLSTRQSMYSTVYKLNYIRSHYNRWSIRTYVHTSAMIPSPDEVLISDTPIARLCKHRFRALHGSSFFHTFITSSNTLKLCSHVDPY
jgi:hypothetical protein